MDGVKTKVLISDKKIEKRTRELASLLAKDYKRKKVILIAVMKGSFIFLADLIRALWKEGLTDVEADFITISSYGKETQSSKHPMIKKDIELDIRNRDVLIVEDIVDTGYTLEILKKHLNMRKPNSLKVLSLLSKPEKREVEVKIDYLGFEIENKWVMGYGLDNDNLDRGRPDIEEKV